LVLQGWNSRHLEFSGLVEQGIKYSDLSWWLLLGWGLNRHSCLFLASFWVNGHRLMNCSWFWPDSGLLAIVGSPALALKLVDRLQVAWVPPGTCTGLLGPFLLLFVVGSVSPTRHDPTVLLTAIEFQ